MEAYACRELCMRVSCGFCFYVVLPCFVGFFPTNMLTWVFFVADCLLVEFYVYIVSESFHLCYLLNKNLLFENELKIQYHIPIDTCNDKLTMDFI